MSTDFSKLADLGWNNFFFSQLDLADLNTHIPVRVTEVHRGKLRVLGASLDCLIQPFYGPDGDEEASATVGDWLLIDMETHQPKRLLERKSLFKRRAPGAARKLQLIAANVDSLFIVTSCNQDFNTTRLERYLALARESDVTAVIVLTKADLTDTPQEYVSAASGLLPGLVVKVLDAREAGSASCLSAWCMPGQTAALVGSSGVGKSTLINTLLGSDHIRTQSIREDDDKGRHTTSARTLYRMPSGGMILDTPGMRELQLTDVQTGLEDVFVDINSLIKDCRFSNCAHDTEPGCAIQEAIRSGTLEASRLKNWQKLMAEETYNTESLTERRKRNRDFSKMVKRAVNNKSKNNRD